jgi:hypothetical protein
LTAVAKGKQTVRKLRDTKSAVRISRPTIAQSGENHENSLSARLYGVSHRVFARSAGILLSIIADLGGTAEEVVYVGDNVLKDVYMAQQAGVTDVHALYGASQHKPEYDLLRKVTHWTPEMVERERAALRPGSITPTHVLDANFAQIIPLFQ